MAVNVALAYPEAKTIHLVMDNLNIHRQKSLADVFGAEMAAQVWDRFTVIRPIYRKTSPSRSFWGRNSGGLHEAAG